MKNDKDTKAKLLESARREFMEKGYMQASLRSICKNAGVTTGALYFFFKEKEDLFASLVEGPLNMLYDTMNNHYQEELLRAEKGMLVSEDFSEDLNTAKQIIHYLFKYHDEFLLIITKSQGSRFEKSLERFVDITEKQYRLLADKITAMTNKAGMDDYMLHWMAHMHIDIFVHMLTHEKSEEAAIKHVESITKYLVMGWDGMFK